MSSIDEFAQATSRRYDTLIAESRARLRTELERIYETAPSEIVNAPEITRAGVNDLFRSARVPTHGSEQLASGVPASEGRHDGLAARFGTELSATRPAAATRGGLADFEDEMHRVMSEMILKRASVAVRQHGAIHRQIVYAPNPAAYAAEALRALRLSPSSMELVVRRAPSAPVALYVPGYGTLINGARMEQPASIEAAWGQAKPRGVLEVALGEQRLGRGFFLEHTSLGRALTKRGWSEQHLARVAGSVPWTGDDADRNHVILSASAFSRSGWRFFAREMLLSQKGQITGSPELAARVFDLAFSIFEDIAVDWANTNANRVVGVALKVLMSVLEPFVLPHRGRDKGKLETLNWCVCRLRELNESIRGARNDGGDDLGARLGHVFVRAVEEKVGSFLVAEAVAIAVEDAPGLLDLSAPRLSEVIRAEPLRNPDTRLVLLGMIAAKDIGDAATLRQVVRQQWRFGGA